MTSDPLIVVLLVEVLLPIVKVPVPAPCPISILDTVMLLPPSIVMVLPSATMKVALPSVKSVSIGAGVQFARVVNDPDPLEVNVCPYKALDNKVINKSIINTALSTLGMAVNSMLAFL